MGSGDWQEAIHRNFFNLTPLCAKKTPGLEGRALNSTELGSTWSFMAGGLFIMKTKS